MKFTMFIIALTTMTLVSTCSAANIDVSHYFENRLSPTDPRYGSFSFALQLLGQRHAQILIETGTARNGDRNFGGDGGSTIIFGDWANKNNAVLYSVDIDPQAVFNARNAVQAYAANVHIVCMDSIQFLTTQTQPIDFLYLDSYDFDFTNPLPSQMHHLREIEAAYPKLHQNSIVMIDDCALPFGGKGKLIIAFLVERGWKIAYGGYQVIMTR